MVARRKLTLTGLFLGMVLSGVTTIPVALAECSNCDLITAVNNVDATLKSTNDMTRKETTQAIINYLAEIEQNRYNLMIMWHGEPAPGTDIAMNAGANLSKFAYGNMVVDRVGDGLASGLGVAASGGVPQKNPQSQIYDKLKKYYEIATTDPTNQTQLRSELSILNFSSLYQNSTINFSDPNINMMIKMITDPFPSQSTLPSENDGDGKDAIAQAAAEKATISVSLNTFVDMLAKRMPNSADTQGRSMLKVMEDESSWRIKDVGWFQNLSTGSQEAVLREIAQMMAFNMWMNYQQYRQNEQIAAMLAASVATQARLVSTMNSVGKVLAATQADMNAASADAKARANDLEQSLGQ